MRATTITAGAISALVVLWLASGQLGEEPEPPPSNVAQQNARVASMQEEKAPTRVRVSTIHASEQSRVLTIRGRTQNKRSVRVQSQIDGILVERPVERGDVVSQGDLLCRISLEDRDAALHEAQAAAEQARIEYEGSQKLSRAGLQSETAIAQAKARLAAALATVERRELEKARLEIRAPFDGVIEDVHLEQGQYVTPGSACVTLVDLDPMLLIGNVTEHELQNLKPGLIATARLPGGMNVQGKLTFIASTAEAATRTYPVEITLANRDFSIPSGITAQIRLPVEQLPAQKISPALLVLNDAGALGVRTISADNIVEFHEVNVLSDEADGIWVTGLPDVAQVIVVGQQLVVAGETVEATHVELNVSQGHTL